MNRVIKFRAWDGTKITQAFSLEAATGGVFQFLATIPDRTEDREWPVMQFTGLLDKNGKEIYEGDIVKNGVIVWAQVSCQWNTDGKYSIDGWYIDSKTDGHYPLEGRNQEVIGNVYESPDLLTNNRSMP